ncbi:hypothetical protein [Streptomyces sp. NPDC001389]|uniref:hypothetical protein n=1 Tax=Streptomyces sp. NPDC001389 TaxID=3364569 RepID=UPI000AE9AF8B
MTGQLFLPGWEIEPCDTADPDEKAHLDLHRQQPAPRAYRNVHTIELQGDLL